MSGKQSLKLKSYLKSLKPANISIPLDTSLKDRDASVCRYVAMKLVLEHNPTVVPSNHEPPEKINGQLEPAGDAGFVEMAKDWGGLNTKKMDVGGSTCGFLCHWLLWNLGCRTQTLVNRSGTGCVYEDTKNILKLESEEQDGLCPKDYWVKYDGSNSPEPGDLVLLRNGDDPATEHVFIFMSELKTASGQVLKWSSADAGQTNEYGRQCARFMSRPFKNGLLKMKNGDYRAIQGWVSLAAAQETFTAQLDPALFA